MVVSGFTNKEPPMPTLIDSHCHIDFPQFDESRQDILADCRQKGMSAIVVPGVSCDQWRGMAELVASINVDATDAPRLLPAYGLHPCFMSKHDAKHLDQLDAQLENGAIAVGEIGLDAFETDKDLPQQMALFRRQLSIAANHHLPIIVHARKTQDLVLKLVRESGFAAGGIMHAFSGSLQQAQRLHEMGFLIGFGGAATYDRARRLRSLLHQLPQDAIVFETDAPDIPPSFSRTRANSPLNLFRIVEMLADVREEPVVELWQFSSKNLIKLFNLST